MTDPTSHVRSIEILETIDIDDCRKVVVELAKQYPNILCELHDDPIVSVADFSKEIAAQLRG